MVLLLLAAGQVQAAEEAVVASTCKVSSGTWKNELGSTATLAIQGNGSVTGTYVNGAPSSCAGPGQRFPLVGFCNNNAITFTVNWGSACNSLTAWSGVYNGSNIKTLWNLVTGGPAQWNSTYAGSDTFVKQ